MTQYTCKTIGTKCRECRGACLDKTNPSQTQKKCKENVWDYTKQLRTR